MEEFVVYILYSAKGDRYYIGSTNDITYRLHQHNAGWVDSTKNFMPWEIKVCVRCSSLSEARKCEYRLKRYKRRDILEKMIKDKKFPWDFKRD